MAGRGTVEVEDTVVIMPNFRLFETQARWSVYLSLLAAVGLAGLTFFVFKGLDWDYRLIPFKPDSPGLGRFRQPAIFATAAVVVLIAVFAAGFGYNSLGEKRNTRQGWSWFGLVTGSVLTTIAVLNLITWQTFKSQ